MAMLIPKIFHRVWLGSNPMPEHFVAYGEGWLRLHPGWEMRTWTDENLPSIRYPHFMDPKYSASMRSDMLRYELLSQFGGVYLDTDMEPRKSIEPLLDGVTMFAGEEGEGVLCTAIMGSIAGEPFWEHVLAEFPSIVIVHNGNSAQTGPWLFTRHARYCDRFKKFPEPYFYPYSWRDKSRRDDPFPDSYAVHRWDGSWMSPDAEKERLIKLRVETERSLLIFVCSCEKHAARQQACRDTWVRSARAMGAEVIFVIGGEAESLIDDTLTVKDSDRWETLPNKIAQTIRFAERERPEVWVFKCDDDTLVMPDRLQRFLLSAPDYSGFRLEVPGVEYCSGGAGYLLSPLAVQSLAAGLRGDGEHEDVETGRALAAVSIRPSHTELFRPWKGHPPTTESGRITEHYVSPELMLDRPSVSQRGSLECQSKGVTM
jgi:hypothetical protein